MTTLFDDVPRDLSGPIRAGNSSFVYLNLSSRPEAERLRTELETWFSNYPAAHKGSLRGDFRSASQAVHNGAFFELLLHEWLYKRGCSLDVHPSLEGRNEKPDFLVTTSDSTSFYLEATVATGESDADRAASRRRREALEAIDSVVVPGYLLSVRTRGTPTTQVKLSEIKSMTRAWLESLPYDAVVSAGDSAEARFSTCFDVQGMEIKLTPISRPLPEVGSRQNSIAICALPADTTSAVEAIHAKLLAKAGKYGPMDRPFVVAINCLCQYGGGDVAADAFDAAIYGYPVAAEDIAAAPPGTIKMSRPDKLIRNVSGLLSAERVTPGNFAQQRARLLLHKEPLHALAAPPFGVPVKTIRSGGAHNEPGMLLSRIMCVNDYWPYE